MTNENSNSKKTLFSKGSAGSLSKRIDYWIAKKELHDSMTSQYSEFAKRFSLEHSIDSIIEVYEGLLKHRHNEYTIRDYNNALTFTIQTDEKGRPLKPYRPILKKIYKLIR